LFSGRALNEHVNTDVSYSIPIGTVAQRTLRAWWAGASSAAGDRHTDIHRRRTPTAAWAIGPRSVVAPTVLDGGV